MTYYIVSETLYKKTNWRASPCCDVGPAKIYAGPHAGNYAVNTAIFDSDPCFEKFRAVLAPLTKAEIAVSDLTPPEDNA